MNEALQLNHFQCAMGYDEKEHGSIEFVLDAFVLVEQPDTEHRPIDLPVSRRRLGHQSSGSLRG